MKRKNSNLYNHQIYNNKYQEIKEETFLLIEDLIIENRLLLETVNYILINKLIPEKQMEHLKKLAGERCIKKLSDGSYCWLK